MSGGFTNKQPSGGLSSAEELWVQTGTAGVLLLEEQVSSPSNTSGYGKMYVKSDKNLYYLDEDGVETQLNVAGSVINVKGEVLAGSQDGGDVDLDLTGLSETYIAVVAVARNGQILDPSTEWSQVGDVITVTGADAGETFFIIYTF